MSFTFQHHHDHADDPVVPRWVLGGAAFACGASLLAAAFGSGGHVVMPPSEPTIARSLQFTDFANGSVLVMDAGTHQHVATLAPGSNAFIRATLRGLAHAVGTNGENRPFLVTAWKDGRVTLADPVSARVIDLEAFGSANVGAFTALLTAEESAP